MKVLILLVFVFNSQLLFGKSKLRRVLESKDPRKYEKLTVYLAKKKYYFSAISFAKEHLVTYEGNKSSEAFNKALEVLVMKAGIDQFYLLSPELLEKADTPAMHYIIAKKYFDNRQYKKTLKHLAMIPPKHRFLTEANHLAGAIWLNRKDFDKAQRYYRQCIKTAEYERRVTDDEKVKRFFDVLKETCIVDQARIDYEKKDFKKAMGLYDQIPKASYIWPYTLLEKAWTAYSMNNYNRSLGALVAYKSPLLASYFIPEAEVLQALSYFKMCLWKDSMIVVENYHKRYAPQARYLRGLLSKHNKSDRYFYQMMTNGSDDKTIKGLITQIRKEIYFNLNLQLLNKVRKEIAKLQTLKNSELKEILLENTVNYEQRQLDIINHFVKKKMYQFINEMNFFSKEMYAIHLEILGRMKNLIYDKKKLAKTRVRGNYDNVERESRQYFWSFKGAFWADELGDYAFGLESNCQEKAL